MLTTFHADAGSCSRTPGRPQLIAHVNETGADCRRRWARALLDRLSDREREVAVAVGRGMSNTEISSDLFVTVATARHTCRGTQIALLAHDAGLTG